jgi:membrane protein DedA with SNARE-associated domain
MELLEATPLIVWLAWPWFVAAFLAGAAAGYVLGRRSK